MAVRLTYVAYTEESLMNQIKTGDSREAAAKAAVESAGGTFLGLYGLMGQEHNVMLISDMEQTDYMSVIAKVMMGGACKDIKTVHCYTGEQAATAMAKATGSSIDYKPAGQQLGGWR